VLDIVRFNLQSSTFASAWLISHIQQFKPPAFKHPGLHTFARSPYHLPHYKARYMIRELNKLGIENDLIAVERLMALKAGLIGNSTNIDGLRRPYQLLLPFLVLGSQKLAWLEQRHGFGEDDIDVQVVVLETLNDAAKIISPFIPLVNAAQ
jgi:hypothetical protein